MVISFFVCSVYLIYLLIWGEIIDGFCFIKCSFQTITKSVFNFPFAGQTSQPRKAIFWYLQNCISSRQQRRQCCSATFKESIWPEADFYSWQFRNKWPRKSGYLEWHFPQDISVRRHKEVHITIYILCLLVFYFIFHNYLMCYVLLPQFWISWSQLFGKSQEGPES